MSPSVASSQLPSLNRDKSDPSLKVGLATYLLHSLSKHQFLSLSNGANTHMMGLSEGVDKS